MGMLYPNIQILFRKYQRKVDEIYEISESATLNLIYDIRAATKQQQQQQQPKRSVARFNSNC